MWPHLGTTGDSTHWYEAEPNDYNDDEDCTQIGISWDPEFRYHWNDISCGSRQDYICERLPYSG